MEGLEASQPGQGVVVLPLQGAQGQLLVGYCTVTVLYCTVTVLYFTVTVQFCIVTVQYCKAGVVSKALAHSNSSKSIQQDQSNLKKLVIVPVLAERDMDPYVIGFVWIFSAEFG